MRKVRIHTDVTFKQGWSIVGGKRYYFRAGFEVEWAQYLQFLKEIGEIEDWEYEPEPFWFEGIKRGTNNYRPDFKVSYKDGDYCWHETKGNLKQKDITKFRRMAKYDPDEKIILVMQRKQTKQVKQIMLISKALEYVHGLIFADKLDYFQSGKKR